MRFEVELCGRIDAQNAPAVEKMLSEQIPVPGPDDEIVFDAKALDYISSSGLRVILKYRNKVRNCVINNVSPDIHEIFEMTGFTNMMEVNRALREVSINGLTLIGKGFNGEVYRLDDERIIKVYNPLSNSIDKIMREKEAVKQAFIHGIPSAISFDIVKVGERFGMIYELIDARTLGAAIEDDPSRLEAYAHRMAQLLKQLHSTVFEPGELPDARDNLKIWADIAEKSGFYSEEVISKLRHVIRSFKPTGTYIHGDFHPGNIMVSNDELVLIDMGDSSVGDPTIDLLGSGQRCIRACQANISQESGISLSVIIPG